MGRRRQKLTFSQFLRHARDSARSSIYGIEVNVAPKVSGLQKCQSRTPTQVCSFPYRTLHHFMQISFQSHPERQVNERAVLSEDPNPFMVQVWKLWALRKQKACPFVRINNSCGRTRQELKSDMAPLSNALNSVWISTNIC